MTFAPRRVRCGPVESVGGWRLKRYTVSHDGAPIDAQAFAGGLDLAHRALPPEACATGRPGIGFTIAHHGPTADYVIACWWDNHNELPTRVFVRAEGDEAWRPANDRESFCVWDLEIMWHERGAYVAHVLAAEAPDPDACLAVSWSWP